MLRYETVLISKLKTCTTVNHLKNKKNYYKLKQHTKTKGLHIINGKNLLLYPFFLIMTSDRNREVRA
jgi:hypothetical protein